MPNQQSPRLAAQPHDAGMFTLVLEKNPKTKSDDIRCGNAIIGGAGTNGWSFRVKVSRNQAVVAFPKIGSFAIGFEKEHVDFNRNLIWVADSIQILCHIAENAEKPGKNQIQAEDVKAAIEMIQREIVESNLDPAAAKDFPKAYKALQKKFGVTAAKRVTRKPKAA